MEFLQNDPAGSTTGTGAGSPVGAPEKRRPGAGLLFLLAPLLCCGGPLIIALLATASAATLGTVGAVLGGVVRARELAPHMVNAQAEPICLRRAQLCWQKRLLQRGRLRRPVPTTP